jgi:hypothetical protein
LEPASTTVDPGSTTTVRLRLRNTGDVVDEYRFTPVGDIAPYITVEPPTIRLYPGTTGTVQLTFAPPRTPDATAGPNPYAVQIVPTEHPEATTVPEGNLTITPFTEVRAELVPHTVKGRFRGRPKLAIDNLGNTKLTASVLGNDNGDQLSYEIHPANVQIEPGRAAFVKATLKPRQITWFGRKENRPYQLAVQRSGSNRLDVDGTYIQRGVLWALNLAAATQFYEREGHLRVPRKHIERIAIDGRHGEDQEERDIKLGAWIGNQRSRAATLTRADGTALRDRHAVVVKLPLPIKV